MRRPHHLHRQRRQRRDEARAVRAKGLKPTLLVATALVLGTCLTVAVGQVRNFVPVTDAMLVSPGPDDWLMYSRTYDAQRFSPLNHINRQNAGRLTQVWSNPLPPGTIEIIPIVHDGVMYLEIGRASCRERV